MEKGEDLAESVKDFCGDLEDYFDSVEEDARHSQFMLQSPIDQLDDPESLLARIFVTIGDAMGGRRGWDEVEDFLREIESAAGMNGVFFPPR